MTNINNDEIVEEVVLNSEDNDINYDSESIVGVKNKGETYNEVSRNDNYDYVSENMMLKNNGINIDSTDEVVEGNNGILVCVNGLKRVGEESYVVGMKQRVNFPINFSEPRCSQTVSYTHLVV